ncbi:hypothetical protein HMPREF1142_0800 [Peptostreptococcaceae bacterium AS15]|nr:hypothetical protein HMPREF1142_0800 [Peptostreptococcaceae bacterium AS15]
MNIINSWKVLEYFIYKSDFFTGISENLVAGIRYLDYVSMVTIINK